MLLVLLCSIKSSCKVHFADIITTVSLQWDSSCLILFITAAEHNRVWRLGSELITSRKYVTYRNGGQLTRWLLGCWGNGGVETADSDAGLQQHWRVRGKDGKFCSLDRPANWQVVFGVRHEENEECVWRSSTKAWLPELTLLHLLGENFLSASAW